jgi:hypothetical protein
MVDHDALADALRALGMLYGSQAGTLAEVARDAGDVREAIRAYILRERPHLLQSYDIDALVGLVRGSMERGAESHPSLEQFGPSR